MRQAGADREIIGEALSHMDLKSTEPYDIIESDQVKVFREKAMKNLMSSKQSLNSLLPSVSKDSNDVELLKKKIEELECELKCFKDAQNILNIR
jgi:hypothetical protein